MSKTSFFLVLGCSLALLNQDIFALNQQPKAPAPQRLTPIVFDIELLSGYRQDNLAFNLYSDTDRASYDDQSSVAYIFQSDLILGATIYNHGYLNVMGGYGLLVNNDATYTSTLVTANVVTKSTTSTHSGYAADWDVMGGGYFNVYKDYIRIAPELGYAWKRVKANSLYAEKFAAPYVGGRLDLQFSKKHNINLVGYYDYFYCIARTDINYTYIPIAEYYNQNAPITGGSIYAYKAGAYLTYAPYKHWSFGLKWEMFHEQTQPQTIQVNYFATGDESMTWTSQVALFSVDYSF